MPLFNKRVGEGLHDLSGASTSTIYEDYEGDRPISGAAERHQSRGEVRRQEKADRQESLEAARTVAKSYILRPPKARISRVSSIGMRNNASTLG